MTKELTYDIILEKIISKDNFSYARYGDGELNALLGKSGQNCDKHEYFPDMGKKLKLILESKPEYYLGLQRLGKEQNMDNPEFERLFQMNNWEDNEIFTYASIRGELKSLKRALYERKVIQVGNTHLKSLFLADVFIEIPMTNCWLQKDKVLSLIRKHLKEDDVVMYSASMMTKWLIDELYKEWGTKITQIDTGSVWDLYAGRITRSYMRDLYAKQKHTLD